jgi:ABC-type lipoprotein export system ATPase subunit
MDERRLSRLRNETFGFVFQFYHLLTELTALENVMLPAMVGGQMKGRVASQIRERGRLLLERVGLGDRINHFPTELSGGEQQRTAIARALVNDPRIVFCDEPTGNLDARIGDGIVSLLSDLFRKEGKTLIVVTHDEKMAKMADRVWNISKKDWENAYHVA